MKHSGYLTTSGAEIYYEQYGSGTPLLILHGNSQSLAVFYPFLRAFRPDFQVILMDSRGHGRSRLSVRTALCGFSTEDMADDVIALLDHLHLSSVHLLGFSDGANIGLEIACKYPERLRSLICLSGNASPDGLLTPLYWAAQMQHAILAQLGNLLLPILTRRPSPHAPIASASPVTPDKGPVSTRPEASTRKMRSNVLKRDLTQILAEQRMCLGTFSRRARSLATCFLFARVRTHAERFLFHRTHFPMKQKKKPDFLVRLTHRVLRRRNLTSLLLHSPRLNAKKLQAISIPVLLIAGTRDLIKTSHSRWLAEQIPTSQLLLMTGGRHTTFFQEPAPYLRAILAFLRRN